MSVPGHMTPDGFREVGKRAVDAIADYWQRVGEMPVLSRAQPGEIAAMLPAAAPEKGGESWDAIFADIERIVMPGLTHWQSPNFFAFFPSNVTGPSLVGEMLSAGLGVQGMLWATSPACTEIEMRVLDWLGRAIGLPESFLFGDRGAGASGGGAIEGTASEATLAAMVAARWRARRGGARGDFVAYASTQAHSSVVKAAMIAGIADGPEDRRVRLIGTDGAYAMRPDLLEAAVREDAAGGRTPFFVAATVGTTSSTAVDPIDGIAAAIGRSGSRLWLHVDAAHSGAACVCPEFRWMLRGVEHADSVAFNPHKWLLTNFDCNCFWTRDRESLTNSMSITPEYLRNKASDAAAVVDYRDWHVPLGRRFRALKLWFVLRHYGLEGLRAHAREGVALASEFEAWVREDARFEVATPRTVNLVCFRLRPREGERAAETDARNKALMDRLNESGRVYLTHTVLPGAGGQPARLVLRMCVGAVRTRREHVERAWKLVQEEADR